MGLHLRSETLLHGQLVALVLADAPQHQPRATCKLEVARRKPQKQEQANRVEILLGIQTTAAVGDPLAMSKICST